MNMTYIIKRTLLALPLVVLALMTSCEEDAIVRSDSVSPYVANFKKSASNSLYSGAITKQMFMRERSSLAAVPTNILLRSISAYSISAFSMARRSISFTPPSALIQRNVCRAA